MGTKSDFTVFTPTFNRREVLHRVYESLLSQTCKSFEWIVVDDGSTDGTYELIKGWAEDPDTWFLIRYFWQKNQHKKVAHNLAVSRANGTLFVIFDSDDRCVPHALERFWTNWEAIPAEKRYKYAGICALCQTEEGEIVGDYFPGGAYIDSNALEMRYKYRVKGEKWGFVRTDVLKNFPFREDIPGYVPESTIWNAISKYYLTRFINEPLRIYFQDVPGVSQREGETTNFQKNSVGEAYERYRILSDDVIYFHCAPFQFYREARRMVRFWFQLTQRERNLVKFWPSSLTGKVLVIAAMPAGLLKWARDCIRLKKVRCD